MHELSITRETPVPREKLYAAWTAPATFPEWYCPKPWYVSDVRIDLRVGGASSMTIHGPNGESFPNEGVYLEVVPNEKLVFTDAFTADWHPNADFMFVAILTFEALPDGGPRPPLDAGGDGKARRHGLRGGLEHGLRSTRRPRGLNAMNPQNPIDEYLLLIRGTQWNQSLSPAELQRVMTDFYAWAESLRHLGAQPLVESGKVVSGARGSHVTDGAFAESKEAIAGYFRVGAPDIETAVRLAQACPIPDYGAEIEVRPVAGQARGIALRRS